MHSECKCIVMPGADEKEDEEEPEDNEESSSDDEMDEAQQISQAKSMAAVLRSSKGRFAPSSHHVSSWSSRAQQEVQT